MPYQLVKALGGLLARRGERGKTKRAFDIPFKQEVTNEVLEVDGVLLVRLGGCSTMQVRTESATDRILLRIVPMANARLLESDAPWQIASDSQLRSWMQSDGAIWRWLLARGIDSVKIEQRLAESAVAAPQAHNRIGLFPLRSKSSLSVP
jgi:hypothetical protein